MSDPPSLNLIRDPWIPVRRQSGSRSTIRPCDLVDRWSDDSIVRVNWGKPELDSGTEQLLIGLLQTAVVGAENESELLSVTSPPTAAQLQQRLELVADAFNVVGDGPLFCQDFADIDGNAKSIDVLLFNTPGEKTVRENADIFDKHVSAPVMSLPAAAISLYTLQQMATSGGAGHRTSLRGGGPLTTILVADTLWETIALNVWVGRRAHPLRDLAPPPKLLSAKVFPWLGPTRTSEKGGLVTTPEEVHKLQTYWGMPRRIRVDAGDTASGVCLVTGRQVAEGIQRFVTQTHGTNYEGGWRHPLSPYREDKGQPIALKGKPSGLDFRDYAGIVVETAVTPAAAVGNYRRWLSKGQISRLRVKASGLDTDKAKVRGWQQAEFPLFPVAEESWKQWISLVGKVIDCAGAVGTTLRYAIRHALGSTPTVTDGRAKWSDSTVDSGSTLISAAQSAYYAQATPAFYNTLNALAAWLASSGPDKAADPSARDEALQHWLTSLQTVAVAVFDATATPEDLGGREVAAMLIARSELMARLRGKDLRNKLGLPEATKEVA